MKPCPKCKKVVNKKLREIFKHAEGKFTVSVWNRLKNNELEVEWSVEGGAKHRGR